MNKEGIGGTLRAFIKSLLQLFATLKCLRTDLVSCCNLVMLHRSYSCNKYFINRLLIWHRVNWWLFLWCELLKCEVILFCLVNLMLLHSRQCQRSLLSWNIWLPTSNRSSCVTPKVNKKLDQPGQNDVSSATVHTIDTLSNAASVHYKLNYWKRI